MKLGIRNPSLKKSLKARTTGELTRSVKKSISPFYGKNGIGWIKDPQKALYNKVYNKTTFDSFKQVRTSYSNQSEEDNCAPEQEKLKNQYPPGKELKILGSVLIFISLISLWHSLSVQAVLILISGSFVYSLGRKEAKNKQQDGGQKMNFTKKKWFWIAMVLLVLGLLGNLFSSKHDNSTSISWIEQNIKEKDVLTGSGEKIGKYGIMTAPEGLLKNLDTYNNDLLTLTDNLKDKGYNWVNIFLDDGTVLSYRNTGIILEHCNVESDGCQYTDSIGHLILENDKYVYYEAE